MAAPKKRQPKAPPEEQGDMKTGRFYCRKIEWWDNYSNQELEAMQRRGRQLREGGFGAVEWDDLTGRK